MKVRFKYSLLITLAALSLLGACGKKENKVNSSTVGIGISGNNPLFTGAAGQAIVTQYNSIRNSVACLPGTTRLTNDVSFFVTGAFTGTKISGNWQPGFMANGVVSELFVGVSAYRDLMFLTKVTNGSQIVGYNVTLSYCEVLNKNLAFPLLVSNSRQLSNFRILNPYTSMPDGITINTATSCGYGLIASAYTEIISQKIPGNLYTEDFVVATSFTKPTCNGQF